MGAIGPLVATVVVTSALTLCIGALAHSRRRQHALRQSIESLIQHVEMHQLSRARIVASRDSMLEVLGTVRLIAISSAAATSSGLDRRGALDSIADTTREAIEEYRTQIPERARPFLTIKRSSAVSSGPPCS